MTKDEFTGILNRLHKLSGEGRKGDATIFLHDTTRLSIDMCNKLIHSLWGCSEVNYFGNNIYELLESAANADPNVQLTPKLMTDTCGVYFVYPDEHAAAFALYKIDKYKHINN
jgi:hypothetical protein